MAPAPTRLCTPRNSRRQSGILRCCCHGVRLQNGQTSWWCPLVPYLTSLYRTHTAIRVTGHKIAVLRPSSCGRNPPPRSAGFPVSSWVSKRPCIDRLLTIRITTPYLHGATSRKVAGSIPDGVNGILHWHNPSGRTMALGLNQPLTVMIPGIFLVGKGGRCVGLTTLPPSCADCHEIWEPQLPGNPRACPGLCRLSYEEPLQQCGKAQFGLRRLPPWHLHFVEGTVKLWLWP